MFWNEYLDSYYYFKKLRDVSKMANDLETTMYAFKQIGYALNAAKDYTKAEKAFKMQLMLAWHIQHKYGELSSYENLALTNFY